jgi:hypothetical protein
MFVTNYKDHFKNTIEIPKFIGIKISKLGCPEFSIASNGNYVFLDNELFKKTVIKLPFYLRAYLSLKS